MGTFNTEYIVQPTAHGKRFLLSIDGDIGDIFGTVSVSIFEEQWSGNGRESFEENSVLDFLKRSDGCINFDFSTHLCSSDGFVAVFALLFQSAEYFADKHLENILDDSPVLPPHIEFEEVDTLKIQEEERAGWEQLKKMRAEEEKRRLIQETKLMTKDQLRSQINKALQQRK